MTLSQLLEPALRACGLLPALADRLVPGQFLWLVGGALRDGLLGRTPADFDLACDFDPLPLARAFAKDQGWSWVPLDLDRGQCRLVRTFDGQTVTIDFARLRAPTLAADLTLRDYTINALALPLTGAGLAPTLSDPLGGAEDLHRRVLRPCSPGVLRDDPLRVLKGVRHMVELGLTVEEETLTAMHVAAPHIDAVAVERIRAEWLRILAAPRLAEGLELLAGLRLLPLLCGGPIRSFDAGVWQRLADWLQVEAHLDRHGLRQELRETLEEGLSVATLGRFALLCRCLAPGCEGDAAQRFKFSNRARSALSAVSRVVATDLSRPADTPRARALWLARIGNEPVFSTLLLAGFKVLSADDALNTLRDWQGLQQRGRVPDLVPPEWIIEHLGVAPGPELGGLLERLREAEIAGAVRARGEGENLLVGVIPEEFAGPARLDKAASRPPLQYPELGAKRD